MNKKTAIIIGAGPAGLSAAYEFLNSTDIQPVIYEMTDKIGGISQTVDHNGYRIDYGPHRFFSKVDRVLDLWESVLPLQGAPARDDILLDRNIPLSKKEGAPDPEKSDRVMLFKNRITRIFFMRKFFDYPISLKPQLFLNLGLIRTAKIGFSYIWSRLFPIRKEKSLEDFFINRFGRELYLTFFKDYTEKVWGVNCHEIPPDWGAQRVKGLSIGRALLDALKKMLQKKDTSLDQKGTETSLIERFMYPKYGAGHMYESIAEKVLDMGGIIERNSKITGIRADGNRITEAVVENTETREIKTVTGDYFLSTMPVKELVEGFSPEPPEEVRRTAEGLMYRDYIQVGLLFTDMILKNKTRIRTMNNIIPDNWIYVQESDVKMGRLDFFNNFSTYMLKDTGKIWLGAEYFCSEGDELWSKSDREMLDFCLDELEKTNMAARKDLLDGVVLRMKKVYPSYFGTYKNFDRIIDFVNGFENLFLVGRNGMHKYNNMDHSIMSGMMAVDNIREGITGKDNLWELNTEEEYHEEKKG